MNKKVIIIASIIFAVAFIAVMSIILMSLTGKAARGNLNYERDHILRNFDGTGKRGLTIGNKYSGSVVAQEKLLDKTKVYIRNTSSESYTLVSDENSIKMDRMYKLDSTYVYQGVYTLKFTLQSD